MNDRVVRFYRIPGISPGGLETTVSKLESAVSRLEITQLSSELCFNVSLQDGAKLDQADRDKLVWLLSCSFESENVSCKSFLLADEGSHGKSNLMIEIGPRLNFSTAWSTNAVSICKSIGLQSIQRVEPSRRYLIQFKPKNVSDPQELTKEEEQALVGKLHDRMTECRYITPITSFDVSITPEPCFEVDVLQEGRAALEKVNKSLGLAFDDWDLEYYTKLFRERVGRNPTSVECFDLAQSNSEHSRHWFFKGRLVIDDQEVEGSLMKMVMSTQENSNGNSVIKFNDNSRWVAGVLVEKRKGV